MKTIVANLKELWKVIAVCLTIGSAFTTVNVFIHNTAQHEIKDTVKSAVRESLSDITDRLGRAEDRLIDHAGNIAYCCGGKR